MVLKSTPPLFVRYFGRYLLPEDFAEEAVLLRRLQEAIGVVRQARSVLDDDLGPGKDEKWLREQEW